MAKNERSLAKKLWGTGGILILHIAKQADKKMLSPVELSLLIRDYWRDGSDDMNLKLISKRGSQDTKSPLNWNMEITAIRHLYHNERLMSYVVDGQTRQLPQVVVLGLDHTIDTDLVSIEQYYQDFHAGLQSVAGREFYLGAQNGIRLRVESSDLNARVRSWDIESRTIVFQGADYYDYLSTNLSLDIGDGNLREQTVTNGFVIPFEDSWLANSTGINVLVFSEDGHMIFQHRDKNIPIRPDQLCSGLSGTIEKEDLRGARTLTDLLSTTVHRMIKEELNKDVEREQIGTIRFLGMTRELIRGGTPEIFCAVNLHLPKKTVQQNDPHQPHGMIESLELSDLATSHLTAAQAPTMRKKFDGIISGLSAPSEIAKAEVSCPMLTNLVLWCGTVCPDRVPTRAS